MATANNTLTLTAAELAAFKPGSKSALPAWALAKSTIQKPIEVAFNMACAAHQNGTPRLAYLQAASKAGIAYGSAQAQFWAAGKAIAAHAAAQAAQAAPSKGGK